MTILIKQAKFNAERMVTVEVKKKFVLHMLF